MYSVGRKQAKEKDSAGKLDADPAALMLLQEGRKTPPFGQDDSIYEIKHDGYRLVAGISNGRVLLNTRKGADATKWFPAIVASLKSISGRPHIIDGEVCFVFCAFDRSRIRARDS